MITEITQTFTYREPLVPVARLTFRESFPDGESLLPDGMPLAARREILVDTKEVGTHFIADFFALYLVRTGSGTHVIGDHEYGLSRGDVYVHPMGIAHNYRNAVRLEQDAFYFQASVFTKLEMAGLRRIKGFWRLLSPNPVAMSSRSYRLHLTPERMLEVESAVSQFWDTLSVNDAIGPTLARNQFVCLLGKLARWYDQGITQIGDATLHSADIASVLEYCEQNYAQDISVPDLASRMFMSPDHFAAVFAREVGYTPAAYLRRLRLERAYALLRTTPISIEEIGKQVGYRTGAQFTRTFRKAHGLSPSEVRGRR